MDPKKSFSHLPAHKSHNHLMNHITDFPGQQKEPSNEEMHASLMSKLREEYLRGTDFEDSKILKLF